MSHQDTITQTIHALEKPHPGSRHYTPEARYHWHRYQYALQELAATEAHHADVANRLGPTHICAQAAASLIRTAQNRVHHAQRAYDKARGRRTTCPLDFNDC